MFVYYKLYRNQFLLQSRHVCVEIRKKKAVPGVEVVHEKARSIRPFFFFLNERPPSLLAS